MGHIILLGDSIFDNARYVPDRPPVIEQVRRSLQSGWRATLLAVDGSGRHRHRSQLLGQLLRMEGPARRVRVGCQAAPAVLDRPRQ
jgi:hypothetical protein